MSKTEILNEIEKISTKPNLAADDVQALSGYLEDLRSAKDEISEAIDIFPALQKYKDDHTIINLQKLCVEIAEFCQCVYASTRSDEERAVYRHMLEKLSK